MKTLQVIVTLFLLSTMSQNSQAAAPFVCSVYASWELSTNTQLSELEKSSLRSVIALFDDASKSNGPMLDLLFKEVSIKYPLTNWSHSELSAELVKLNHASYPNTLCFEMITHGIDYTVNYFSARQ